MEFVSVDLGATALHMKSYTQVPGSYPVTDTMQRGIGMNVYGHKYVISV